MRIQLGLEEGRLPLSPDGTEYGSSLREFTFRVCPALKVFLPTFEV